MQQFLEIVHGSDQYRQACVLRDGMLRKPLGLSLYDEDLDAEASYRHFGIIIGKAIVACLVILPLASGEMQLKQMAVDEAFHGRGLGRKLMEEVEVRLIDSGVKEIRLHARETAIGFYQRLGFEGEGAIFLEVSIPHLVMRKRIGSD